MLVEFTLSQKKILSGQKECVRLFAHSRGTSKRQQRCQAIIKKHKQRFFYYPEALKHPRRR